MMNGYHVHGMTKYFNRNCRYSAENMDSIARMDQMHATTRLSVKIADYKLMKRQRNERKD